MAGNQQEKPVFQKAELVKEIEEIKKALNLKADASELAQLNAEFDKIKDTVQPK